MSKAAFLGSKDGRLVTALAFSSKMTPREDFLLGVMLSASGEKYAVNLSQWHGPASQGNPEDFRGTQYWVSISSLVQQWANSIKAFNGATGPYVQTDFFRIEVSSGPAILDRRRGLEINVRCPKMWRFGKGPQDVEEEPRLFGDEELHAIQEAEYWQSFHAPKNVTSVPGAAQTLPEILQLRYTN